MLKLSMALHLLKWQEFIFMKIWWHCCCIVKIIVASKAAQSRMLGSRRCEERSDEAIQKVSAFWIASSLRSSQRRLLGKDPPRCGSLMDNNMDGTGGRYLAC